MVEHTLQCHIFIAFCFQHIPCIVEEFVAALDVLSFLAAEILAQTRLCFGGGNKIEPVLLRVLAAGGENLHLVAAFEYITERNQVVVHLCADTMLTQLGVEQERKIKSGCTLRHGFDFSFRGKNKHLLCKQVQFECVEKFHCILLGVLQDFLYLAKPFV